MIQGLALRTAQCSRSLHLTRNRNKQNRNATSPPESNRSIHPSIARCFNRSIHQPPTNDAPALLRSMLLQSLTPITTATLRLSAKSPAMPSSVLGLRIGRRERRTVLRAKDRSFNVEVDAGDEEDEDSGEKCLNRFDREVARTGLAREWRRRRFHENAREKRMRRRREAALLRRRRKGDSSSRTENADSQEDFWASDESFEALVNDEHVSNEEIELRFQDDGEGTWRYIDGTSRS